MEPPYNTVILSFIVDGGDKKLFSTDGAIVTQVCIKVNV